MLYRQKGFTIVELLIVIVVIGILAAIVIVSYIGIQGRSRDSRTLAGILAYTKSISRYRIDNNNQEPVQLTGIACLGAVNDCNAAADATLTAEIATKLSTVMGSAARTTLTSEGALVNSITNYPITGYGNYTGLYVYYVLKAASTCPNISGTVFMYSSGSTGSLVCRHALPPIQ